MKTLVLSLLLLTFSVQSIAQVAIGQWRDHFPWTKGVSITQSQDVIYMATSLGVLAYDKTDNSVERLTKANALSDAGITVARFNPHNQTLFVGYENGNIDLIKGNITINMSDIKRDDLIGDKAIYNVIFDGKLAYVSTGFGIVVVDTDQEEVAGTYIIGPNESFLQINAIALDDNFIWAATQSDGLFRADINSPNLADFNNWSKVNDVPNTNGPFNQMVTFGGKLYLNYRNPVWNSDTLYTYDGTNWSPFPGTNAVQNLSLQVTNNQLVVTHYSGLQAFATDGSETANIFSNSNSTKIPADAIFDGSHFFMAGQERGLIKTNNPYAAELLSPNGPKSAAAFDLEVYESEIWMAAGAFASSTWSPLYNTDGFASYIDGTWTSYNQGNQPLIDTVDDFIYMAVDPEDEQHVFAASWRGGLFELQDGEIIQTYNDANSTLQLDPAWSPTRRIGVGGIEFDDDGNLWMINTGVSRPLSVKLENGTWKSYDFNSSINNKSLRGLMIDRAGYKWFLNKNSGMVVFDDNGTPTDTTDDQFKHLTNSVGLGGLPSNTVNAMITDIDGEVWVGTNEGLAVFYNTESIFTGGDYDAQQILIEQDGNIQILLETEIITCFAIDGANRKWIGTSNGGVFLMSADGTEQIFAFNSANSPLISDNINDIAINYKTGEVFIATDQGIISYQGHSTGFRDDFTDVYAFPNPVRPGYDGPIAIRGLVRDTDVKITDISGNLVYETTSDGGTALWPGTNFNGQRVQTGVYIVFLSSQDGKKTEVTKVLFVN